MVQIELQDIFKRSPRSCMKESGTILVKQEVFVFPSLQPLLVTASEGPPAAAATAASAAVGNKDTHAGVWERPGNNPTQSLKN